jgi:hypothetical protein
LKRVLAIACVLLFCGPLPAEEEKNQQKAAHWTDRLDLSGLFYLTYEDGRLDGERFSKFYVTRAYLTAEAEILPYLSSRITIDTSQDLEMIVLPRKIYSNLISRILKIQ